jgi:hypothetical protein
MQLKLENLNLKTMLQTKEEKAVNDDAMQYISIDWGYKSNKI